MIVKSIYPSMEISATTIPAHENVKLLLRHSIRSFTKKSNDDEELPLTLEGSMMAQYFGQNIQYTIGEAYCSPFKRCVQTVEQMLIGRGECRVIHLEDSLSSVLIRQENNECQTSISELGLKRIVSLLASGIYVSGIKSLDYCVGHIIDLMFSSGNTKDTLDIYCTHDLHIALVTSCLFGISHLEDVRDNWPYMLEGIYLWGKREDFHIAWREKTNRVIGFLM